jgi:hypothetical protein
MRAAFYWWHAAGGRSWRPVLTVLLVGGLLGAVALGAVAGARRTLSAYGRYLTSTKVSDAFVNVPGAIPGMALTRPITLISKLPGIAASAAYLGLADDPVVHGRIDDSHLSNGLIGSYTGSFFRQDRMTILAGRLPADNSTDQIALSPRIASLFGVGVGGEVTYAFSQTVGPAGARPVLHSFRVTAIVDIPPVLVDSSDQPNVGVLPPGATRRLLASYEFAWVGVRLERGAAGISALQQHLAALAASVQRQVYLTTHQKLPGLTFQISRTDVTESKVQEAIRPQAVALVVLAGIAALALLVFVGQGLAQLLGRSGPDLAVVRALGGSRAQAALAVSLPGAVAILGGMVLAVAGAVAVSPLAPVGAVRQFDPARGVRADGLVLGAGSALLAALLLSLLAVLAWRTVRKSASPVHRRPSVVAQAAVSAGLPASAVVGGRNALEAGSGGPGAPARTALLGSVAAVTAVIVAVVFGTSLTGLVSHPARYGWNWDVLIQAEGGYGNFTPGVLNRLVGAQPLVARWSSFGFGQLTVDGRVIPVLGVQRERGSVEPPTTSGRPITGNNQIELGTVTLRELGQRIGDTVSVSTGSARRILTIVGTVTLPSFGVNRTDHVSLGRGAMLSEQALLTAEGAPTGSPTSGSQASQAVPSAVAIDLVRGTSAAQRAQLVRRITAANPDGTPGGTYELQLDRALAAEIVNASQMGGQPLALALGVAAGAILSLALTVLASVRRRRRELALLKTLGMTRGQVRSVVAWQASVVLIVAALIGVPLGVAAGRWAWTAFANSLGVVPAAVVPAPALVLGFVGLLAAGNLLAAWPAALAARTPPAAALRAE